MKTLILIRTTFSMIIHIYLNCFFYLSIIICLPTVICIYVWIHSVPSPRPVVIARLKSPVCPTIAECILFSRVSALWKTQTVLSNISTLLHDMKYSYVKETLGTFERIQEFLSHFNNLYAVLCFHKSICV